MPTDLNKEAARLEAEIVSQILSLANPGTAAVRNIRRTFSKRIQQTDPRTVIELGTRLADRSHTFFRFVGYELILNHPQAMLSLGARSLERLGQGIDSWSAVDCFALILSGPAWREGLVTDTLIHGWAQAIDRWWRRAALVSTVPLNNRARGGQGDTERTLRVCELLQADRDEMVVKALSWALRELSKRDAAAVQQFIDQHQQTLAPLVMREVRNKLRTGLKNPRS